MGYANIIWTWIVLLLQRTSPFLSIFWNSDQHSRSLVLRQNAGYSTGSAGTVTLFGTAVIIDCWWRPSTPVVVDETPASAALLWSLDVVVLVVLSSVFNVVAFMMIDVDVAAFSVCDRELCILNVWNVCVWKRHTSYNYRSKHASDNVHRAGTVHDAECYECLRMLWGWAIKIPVWYRHNCI